MEGGFVELVFTQIHFVRLTNDDDQDSSHYLKSQGEGNECQNSDIVPEDTKEKVVLKIPFSKDFLRQQ